MKYKSTLFDEARGKVGNLVASANRDGNYFRNKVTPKNPKTAKQLAVRSSFSANAKAWRTLTQAQRTAWIALGALITKSDTLGNKYHPTGEQLFVGVNGTRDVLTLGMLNDPPATPPAAPQMTVSTVVADSFRADVPAHGQVADVPQRDEALSFDVGGFTGTGSYMVYATAPYSAGRNFVGPSQFRYINAHLDAAPGTSNDLAAYVAAFGHLAKGSKISLKIVPVTDDGFLGTPVRVDVVVD